MAGMIRTLPATWTLRSIDWRWLVRFTPLTLLVALDLAATAHLWLTWLQFGANVNDWDIFSRVAASDPYATPGFHWTPPAAWILDWLVVPLGLAAWRVLHVLALVFFRDWRLILLVGLSFPFIYDVADGNMLMFAFVAAWCALRGSKVGTVAFFAITLLIPRPLMIPVAVWLLWKRPEWRVPVVGMALAVLALSVASGQFMPMLAHFSQTPEIGAFFNIGPSRLIGSAWIPIGVLLAAWLTWKGRLGLASLAISPYLIGYYLLFAFLELADRPPTDAVFVGRRGIAEIGGIHEGEG